MPSALLVRPTFVLLGVWLTLSSPLRAQPQTSRAVDTFLAQIRETCGDTPEADHFVEALRVELSTAPFTASDLAATKAHFCDPERGVVSVQLSNRQLTLDVSDVPPAARPRTLAVAFAETLRLPSPAPASPPPRGSKRPSSSPTRSPLSSTMKRKDLPKSVDEPDLRPDFLVPITVRTLVLGPEQTVAIGANVGLSYSATQTLSVAAHVGYLTAHHRSALGNAHLHAGTVEGAVDLTLLRPSAHSTVELGLDAMVYRAVVLVESAWGIDEPDLDAWFALWGLHVSLSTALTTHARVFARVGGVKDLVGLRLSAGGEKAMSFYGFGAELRLGAGYAW